MDLIPAPGTVYEEGTFRNKANDLSDTVAAMFGLCPDAVQNDVFGVLSRFHAGLGNEYVWAKTKVTGVVEVGSDKNVFAISTSNAGDTLFVSDTVIANDDGTVSLGGTVTTYESPLSPNDTLAAVKGKYFTCTNTAFDSENATSVYYAPDTATASNYNAIALVSGCKYVIATVSTVHYGYVNSPDPNAYPIDDGYTYAALGQLGAKMQIATGSYTGTGTYTDENKNSITFDFVPKCVVVAQSGLIWFAWFEGISGYSATLCGSSSYAQMLPEVNGTTFSWYNSTADKQLNASGMTYYYIAIG